MARSSDVLSAFVVMACLASWFIRAAHFRTIPRWWGMWGGLWTVIWVMNLGCVLFAVGLCQLGGDQRMLSLIGARAIPDSYMSPLAGWMLVSFVGLVFCLKCYQRIEEAEAIKPPGEALTLGHAFVLFVKSGVVHVVTIAVLVVEFRRLIG